MQRANKLKLRVTHNDTKCNNVLYDAKTGKYMCVIDLDTVMPGSILYDFGDGLRIGGSTAAEDETDLSKVRFDVDCFRAFAEGYLSEMGSCLTERELELLPCSIRLLTFENGVRFLTDYLNGDTYFKIHRPEQNIDRARNQFKLCEELKLLEPQLCEIIRSLVK